MWQISGLVSLSQYCLRYFLEVIIYVKTKRLTVYREYSIVSCKIATHTSCVSFSNNNCVLTFKEINNTLWTLHIYLFGVTRNIVLQKCQCHCAGKVTDRVPTLFMGEYFESKMPFTLISVASCSISIWNKFSLIK